MFSLPPPCLEHQNVSTRMCSGVRASHSTTLCVRDSFPHPRHENATPVSCFCVWGIPTPFPPPSTIQTLVLHSLLPRREERDPTVVFFMSRVSLPLYHHPLPPRHKERDYMVAFFVSAPFPAPSTAQTPLDCSPSPYPDYFSILYILNSKVVFLLYILGSKIGIMSFFIKNNVRFRADNFHLESARNPIRTARNQSDSEWKLGVCSESERFQLEDMGHRKVLVFWPQLQLDASTHSLAILLADILWQTSVTLFLQDFLYQKKKICFNFVPQICLILWLSLWKMSHAMKMITNLNFLAITSVALIIERPFSTFVSTPVTVTYSFMQQLLLHNFLHYMQIQSASPLKYLRSTGPNFLTLTHLLRNFQEKLQPKSYFRPLDIPTRPMHGLIDSLTSCNVHATLPNSSSYLNHSFRPLAFMDFVKLLTKLISIPDWIFFTTSCLAQLKLSTLQHYMTFSFRSMLSIQLSKSLGFYTFSFKITFSWPLFVMLFLTTLILLPPPIICMKMMQILFMNEERCSGKIQSNFSTINLRLIYIFISLLLTIWSLNLFTAQILVSNFEPSSIILLCLLNLEWLSFTSIFDFFYYLICNMLQQLFTSHFSYFGVQPPNLSVYVEHISFYIDLSRSIIQAYVSLELYNQLSLKRAKIPTLEELISNF